MTLFPKRYQVLVVGSDGLMHTDTASHHFEVSLVRFLLEKKAAKPIRRVDMYDTFAGRSVTNAEYHAA